MRKRLSTDMSEPARRGIALVLIVGIGLSVLLAAGVSVFASSSPDGLESVAEQHGFADKAQDSAVQDSPFADYGVSGLQQRWAGGLAGLVGVAATGVAGFVLFRLLAVRRGGRRGDRESADTRSDAPELG